MRVTIGNSFSKVEGLSIVQEKKLREVLSYTPSDAYFSGRGGPGRNSRRYLIDRKGMFPTGLLYLVSKCLPEAAYRDLRVMPVRNLQASLFINNPPSPYGSQVSAVQAAFTSHRGVISAPTGTGKSLIAALIVNCFQLKTLIVTPSLELKRQLTASFKYWFGADRVGDQKDNKLVIIENVDALKMKPMDSVDLLIIDEYHRSASKTYRELNKKAWSNIYYRIGLTATNFRSDDSEQLLLHSVLSQEIHKITYQEAVADKQIVPVEAYYYDLPKQDMEGNEGSWASVYSELVVNNKVRNGLIANLIKKLNDQNLSTLCLVKEIKHGDMISKDTGVAFATGENDNNRELILEFCLRERNALIGTTGVIGEGVDTKPAEYVILAAGGKAKVQLMQQVGRGLRTYLGKETCKVILFRDTSHKWLLTHFNSCVKILKEEYGVKPIKLEWEK